MGNGPEGARESVRSAAAACAVAKWGRRAGAARAVGWQAAAVQAVRAAAQAGARSKGCAQRKEAQPPLSLSPPFLS